jgi:trimethylamine corrinoid protein
VIEIANKVIADGHDPLELMNLAFIPGINEVGDLFGRGQLFLPELMQAADVMKVATDIINAELAKNETTRQKKAGRVLIATVKGDVHDIGKCIVVSLMKANGFEVTDLGRDIDVDTIIKKAIEVDADIIGTSALLTTTMKEQKVLEEALKSAGLRDRFLTMVGGAPVTPRWAARIGADAYAEDAQDGVVKVKELLSQK